MLNIDLNKFVSEEINEQINSLQAQIKKLNNDLSKERQKNAEIHRKFSKVEEFEFLADFIKSAYCKIESLDRKTKVDNQFTFLVSMIETVFRVKPDSPIQHYSGGSIPNVCVPLAVYYYSQKDLIINIIKILGCSADDIEFIRNFKMPFDWSKSEVFDFVSFLPSVCNGEYWKISHHWLESRAGKKDVPYYLVFQNPYILDDNIFERLLKNLDGYVSGNAFNLFQMPIYQPNMPIEKLQKLGEKLCNLNRNQLDHDDVKGFIRANLQKFNKTTIDFLSQYIHAGYSGNMFYFENFPIQYQEKLLSEMSLSGVIDTFQKKECKWSDEQKLDFLVRYSQK